MGSTAPAFASASEALDVVLSGLRFLADADATELSCEEQTEILRGLERVHSVETAARTSVLSAFTTGQGYSADADYSARSWLMHQTGITKGVSGSHTALGQASGPAPADLRRDGRRTDLGVLRPDSMQLDRQAPG